jgi:tRNA 2-thiocytidine biosynthesis protein TtcA
MNFEVKPLRKLAGSGCELLIPLSERKPLQEIERSIIKTYRRQLWAKFNKAVRNFKLVEEGDRIAVAISGGLNAYRLNCRRCRH